MPLLMAVAGALTEAGFTVLRYNLPFRQKRPTGPPSGNAGAADRAGLRAASQELREIVTGRVFLGGQSYGGRQASMLAAEDARSADGLLLLSYPLHPPGKADRLRTEHFSGIECPTLFVHGGRDPFATFEELTGAVRAIRGTTAVSEIASAGHDLARGKFNLMELLVKPFQSVIA